MFTPVNSFSYAVDLSIFLVEKRSKICLFFLWIWNFHSNGSFNHSLVKLEGRLVYLFPSLIRLFLGGSPIQEFCLGRERFVCFSPSKTKFFHLGGSLIHEFCWRKEKDLSVFLLPKVGFFLQAGALSTNLGEKENKDLSIFCSSHSWNSFI